MVGDCLSQGLFFLPSALGLIRGQQPGTGRIQADPFSFSAKLLTHRYHSRPRRETVEETSAGPLMCQKTGGKRLPSWSKRHEQTSLSHVGHVFGHG